MLFLPFFQIYIFFLFGDVPPELSVRKRERIRASCAPRAIAVIPVPALRQLFFMPKTRQLASHWLISRGMLIRILFKSLPCVPNPFASSPSSPSSSSFSSSSSSAGDPRVLIQVFFFSLLKSSSPSTRSANAERRLSLFQFLSRRRSRGSTTITRRMQKCTSERATLNRRGNCQPLWRKSGKNEGFSIRSSAHLECPLESRFLAHARGSIAAHARASARMVITRLNRLLCINQLRVALQTVWKVYDSIFQNVQKALVTKRGYDLWSSREPGEFVNRRFVFAGLFIQKKM